MIATISVKYMTMLILITIILIGLAPLVTWLANQYRLQVCVQRQVKRINDINDVVKEVLQNGSPKIEKLKMDGVCTECIWYNDTAGYRHLEIKFIYAATTYPVNVSVAWIGAEIPVGQEANCENAKLNDMGKTYTLQITPNELLVA